MWVSLRERERPILAYPQPVVWEPQAGEVRPRVRPAGRGNRTWFGWSLNSPRPNEKKMVSEVGWTVFTQDFVGFGMEKERYSERKESERSSKTWPLTALGS